LELPLSYKAFFSNLKGFEFRYTDKAYYTLVLAFFEMIDKNIIKIINATNKQYYITKPESKIENLFSLYRLMLRPLQNKQAKMELSKYVYRIGVYGYYLTNTFSKNSIKKVIYKELSEKNMLHKKGFWPFTSYKLKHHLEDEINKIDFEDEKNKFISRINQKLNLNVDELEKITSTVHSNLLTSLNTVRPAILQLGK
jgi:hypothetical protein